MGGLRTLKRIHEYSQAASGEEDLGSQISRLQGGEDLNQVFDAPRHAPELPPDEVSKRVKAEGLEGRLPHPSTNSAALELQLQEAHEERDREVALARGPNGFVPGAFGLVTSLGVGMIDPVNAAAFMIPVMGEARAGALLARAGDSIFARAGVKAGIGAAQGAAGGAALAPADWWLKTQDGQDYTMADALHSVLMSAGMGAAAHAGFGAFGDVRARARGLPLPGSPEDLLLRGLMHGTHVPAAALESEGLPQEDIPGIGPAADLVQKLSAHGGETTVDLNGQRATAGAEAIPPHPAEILADLPPAAREDVARAAIADVINGQPVRAAEMLQEAAKEDPRIAESLAPIEAFHGSPHDFDRFDSSKIGEGEGAQSYGHGLYFAENEAVAGDYRRKLSPAEEPTLEGGLWKVRSRENGEQVERDFKTKAEADAFVADKAGAVYKVRIAADRGHFLDWDKPLSEQSVHVRDALLNHPDPSIAGTAAKHGHDIPAMYSRIGQRVTEDGRYDQRYGGRVEASSALNEAGIPGIKYLDQGSRTTASDIAYANARLEHPELPEQKIPQSHNFVVFDDKLIRITHKNGQEVGLDEIKASRSQVPGIDATHDVVSGANSSKDPNGPVYIDRRIPEFSPRVKDRNGQPANLWKYLSTHEVDEGRRMAAGEPYKTAHPAATAAERAAVEADGVDWAAYTHEIDGYLASIEHEKAQNPPPDTHVDPQAAIGHHRSENKAGGAPASGEAAPPPQPSPARAGEGAPPNARPDLRVVDGGKQKADFKKFGDVAHPVADPDLASASKAAEKSPEPQSTEPGKAVSAAQAAAGEAEKLLADILPGLSPEEREMFEKALFELDADRDAREQIVRDGAACLAAAVA